MKKFWTIIKWILFWYYLIPYYLFTKYVFKGKNQKLYATILSVLIAFFCLKGLIASPAHNNEKTSSNESRSHVVVKKLGVSRLAKDEAKAQVLAKEKDKKQKELAKLAGELAAVKKAKEKAAAKNAAVDSPVSSQSSKTSHSVSHHTDHTDMDTSDSQQIIGNRNSKIYHVPGQAGYRMNSKNAVYFSSEQEAINAGYRKAKR